MKTLLILSGKGGTGKTTTAGAFIEFSKAKAIADCDVDAPNLHILRAENLKRTSTAFYGGEKAEIDKDKCIGCGKCKTVCRFNAVEKLTSEKYQVIDYACEGCGVCEYVCPQNAITLQKDIAGTRYSYRQDGVFETATLKMGRGNSGKLVSEVKSAMRKSVSSETPLAIIDGSPGIGCPVIASITGVDLVLLVAEPSCSGLSDLKRIVKTANILHTDVVVCINKYDVSIEGTKAIEAFCKDENILCVGKIPFDRTASEAINSGKSIAEFSCPARDALLDIYHRVAKILEV